MIKFFNETITNSPTILTICIVLFFVECITILDTRIIQSKKDGTLPPDYKTLPLWTSIFIFIEWGLKITLLVLNWKFGLMYIIFLFILKVLPVLETIGEIITIPIRRNYKDEKKNSHCFNIILPSEVLQADNIKSIRNFSERTDWINLPSSIKLHAQIISEVLKPEDTDTSLAEEGLLLQAANRILLYLKSPDSSNIQDTQVWIDWIDKIENLIVIYKNEEYDGLELCKEKMKLSIELIEKATLLIPTDKTSSEILMASGNEVGESADIQTVNKSNERVKSALVIAEMAKSYSFDEFNK